MRRLVFTAAALLLVLPVHAARWDPQTKPAAAPAAKPAAPALPVVVLTTTKGDIDIELFTSEAPKSTARMLELAKDGFYRGTRFHWVQPWLVQGGDQLTRNMTKQDTWGKGGSGPRQSLRPIGVAEPTKRAFERGIVAMAHQAWETAEQSDCQFFIVKVANPTLKGKYSIVGRVAKGMDVVDKITVDDMIKNVTVR